jgi:hypothetical protein
MFMQQFDIHWGLNNNHEVMSNPYLHTMYFLFLIKGPLVNDLVNNQVTDLRNKVICTVNLIAQTEDVLWNDVRDTFIAAYMDSAKAQTAFTKLQHLKMHKGDLDTYIATFKHLARDAGYDTNTASTVNMFTQNLKTGLLSTIMHRECLPITFMEWIAAVTPHGLSAPPCTYILTPCVPLDHSYWTMIALLDLRVI